MPPTACLPILPLGRLAGWLGSAGWTVMQQFGIKLLDETMLDQSRVGSAAPRGHIASSTLLSVQLSILHYCSLR